MAGKGVGFSRQKQIRAADGTLPESKGKRTLCKEKTDRPFLGNSIDTGPEL